MSLSRYMERLEFLDSLIRRKATGNPDSLAKKMNLSRSQTLNFLKEMKAEGFPIKFSKQYNSYYYLMKGKLVNHLFEEEKSEIQLLNSEMRKISGGKRLFPFYSKSDYIRLWDNNFVK